MTRPDHMHPGTDTDLGRLHTGAACSATYGGTRPKARTLSCLSLLAVCLAACLTLSACAPGPLTQAAPERRFYAIQAARPDVAPPPRNKTVLKVRPIRISPAFQGKEMVYRLGATEYEQDYYNLFFTQPAQDVAQATRQWLDASGLFASVVDSTSQVADTHLLEGVVNAVYGDFRDKGAPKAVLEMQFFLLANSRESYQVIFSRSYSEAVPLPAGQENAAGLAAAYGQALSGILSKLEADLRQAR